MKKILAVLILIFAVSSTIVSQKIVVAKDGSGDFKTIQEAIHSIDDSLTTNTTVFIKNGVYVEKLFVPKSKSKITFIGESKDKTIISYADHAKINNMGTAKTYTMYIGGNDITLQNLTVRNNAPPVAQAIALYLAGTRIKVINCKLLGNQDTLYTGEVGRQHYFENCYIEGTTDYIFGPATAWFEKCIIHSKKISYVTAASTPENVTYGYVFNKCKLTAEKEINKVYLGRPWRPYAAVLFMRCKMGAHIRPEGWHNWRDPEKEKTARYYEYKNKGKGAKTENRVKWSKVLNDAEAKKYTLNQVFTDWNPKSKK